MTAINQDPEFAEIPAQLEGDYVLRMRGDHMAPGILDGDWLTVRKQATADPGQIVTVTVNGEATARTYWPDDPEPGKVRLASTGEPQSVIVDAASVRVLGVVVGLFRSL